jgi:FAD dependent oxidoreductase
MQMVDLRRSQYREVQSCRSGGKPRLPPQKGRFRAVLASPRGTRFAGRDPFQIPHGALILVRIRNLIAAAKKIGTTHITNGHSRNK